MEKNYVHVDEIWKDHINHEMNSQLRVWPRRWGYLVHEYESLDLLLEGKPPLPPLPPPKPEARNAITFPPIKSCKISERPKNFPMSTAQEIGWHIDDVVTDMNKKCDTNKRGLNGLAKMFNWSEESVP